MTTTTFGPAFDARLDGERVMTQMERIRDFMLNQHSYQTLNEIAEATGDPVASISAQLRHLRKPRFGGFVVAKRRRYSDSGLWEYLVFRG